MSKITKKKFADIDAAQEKIKAIEQKLGLDLSRLRNGFSDMRVALADRIGRGRNKRGGQIVGAGGDGGYGDMPALHDQRLIRLATENQMTKHNGIGFTCGHFIIGDSLGVSDGERKSQKHIYGGRYGERPKRRSFAIHPWGICTPAVVIDPNEPSHYRESWANAMQIQVYHALSDYRIPMTH